MAGEQIETGPGYDRTLEVSIVTASHVVDINRALGTMARLAGGGSATVHYAETPLEPVEPENL